jgi:hypothetical protein
MLSKIKIVNSAITVHQKLIIDTDEQLFNHIKDIQSLIKEKGFTTIQLSNDNARYIKAKKENTEALEISHTQINITQDKVYWSGRIKDTTFQWETIKVTQNELFSSLNLALTERE